MNAVSAINNQLEIPLKQVAQLLNVPSFVVVRLATRLHYVLPASIKTKNDATVLMKPKSQVDLFFSLTEVQLLEDCIQAIRQGHSLSEILEGIQLHGNTLQLLTASKKRIDSTTVTGFARLPTYKGKLPPTTTKKAIALVNKSIYTTPQVFPVLKKRNNPPKEWFKH